MNFTTSTTQDIVGNTTTTSTTSRTTTPSAPFATATSVLGNLSTSTEVIILLTHGRLSLLSAYATFDRSSTTTIRESHTQAPGSKNSMPM